MYLRSVEHRLLTGALSAARGLGTLAAAAVGFAIPAAWLRLGAVVHGDGESGGMAFLAVLVIFGGIVASYLAIIAVVGALAARRLPPGESPPPRRYNWNRSMRDARRQGPQLNALERVFVVTTILVGTAYMVWFVLFAEVTFPSA